jgi:spore protease
VNKRNGNSSGKLAKMTTKPERRRRNMGDIRTDLAEEAADLAVEGGGSLEGVLQRSRSFRGCAIREVEITSPAGEEALGKPVGRYTTIHLPSEGDKVREGAEAVSLELSRLMEGQGSPQVLVAGLGNGAITPDAIGPWTVEEILVTRHLKEELPGVFSPVSAFSTGVMGKTGVETGELLEALVEKLSPTLVVAVDALAARGVERLCNTIQLSDTGIVPGSGVGNSRKAVSEKTLGVPVIALGVPTVVDASTLAQELTGHPLPPHTPPLMVTPREIHHTAAQCAHLLAVGINMALHGLSYEDAVELMG